GPAVIFKRFVDVLGDFHLSTLLAYELLHARSGEIIQILGIYGRLRAIRLRAECLHSISLVPLEMARGCLGQHVAVRIEGVGEGQWPSSDGPQPVAALLNREIAQVSICGIAVLEDQHAS